MGEQEESSVRPPARPTAARSLERLPAVDAVLQTSAARELVREFGRTSVTEWTRLAIEELRQSLLSGEETLDRAALEERALESIADLAERRRRSRLDRVINATGVLLHTNLGRAPLAERAVIALERAARATAVEMDLPAGERRSRGHEVEGLFRSLTGAEACLVVNNCAAATLLAFSSLARGREVVVSRGQLIEIGGAYRLPDVFAMSGAVLREVGTTNRTRLGDYAAAIGPETAALLRVHPSNFRVVGFTESVPIRPMVELAHAKGIVAIDDLGSGCLVDLSGFGLPEEPVVGESLAAGADLVLFSGDKLLGGPQCGVLLGNAWAVARCRDSALARALRVDKLTLAALEATLEIHLAGNALREIPILRQLTCAEEAVRTRALGIVKTSQAMGAAAAMEVCPDFSAVGGGSLPTAQLPTWVVAIETASCSAEEIARRLRTGRPPIVARVQDGRVLLDPRTIFEDEEPLVARAIAELEKST